MTNYLKDFGPQNNVATFQAGGAPGAPAAPAPAGDPAAGGGGDPMQEMLMQIVQSQDPNMALEFCNQLAQQMGIGGDAGGAPPAGAPVPQAGNGMSVPGYRKGGSIVFKAGGVL
jgi:hypothetical protein